MAGVEEVENMKNMTEIEVMTGIKGMKNDIRKEKRASLQRRLQEVKWGREHKRLGN